jgi:hypothetical protein
VIDEVPIRTFGAMMNSFDTLLDHPVHDASAQTGVDTARKIAAQSAEAASNRAAQGDCPERELQIESADDDTARNPLWLVAIASACMFAAFVVLTSFG